MSSFFCLLFILHSVKVLGFSSQKNEFFALVVRKVYVQNEITCGKRFKIDLQRPEPIIYKNASE